MTQYVLQTCLLQLLAALTLLMFWDVTPAIPFDVAAWPSTSDSLPSLVAAFALLAYGTSRGTAARVAAVAASSWVVGASNLLGPWPGNRDRAAERADLSLLSRGGPRHTRPAAEPRAGKDTGVTGKVG